MSFNQVILQIKLLVILFSLAIGGFCLSATNSHALSIKAKDHAQQAFAYSKRGKWKDALRHAQYSGETPLQTLITYQYLMDSRSGAHFNEYIRFIEQNPNWPNLKKLGILAELSLNKHPIAGHDLLAWFAHKKPITGLGKIALVKAYEKNRLKNHTTHALLVREAWHLGDFNRNQEKNILKKYRKWLTSKDHIKRVDRLIWEGKISAAKRILHYIPSSQRALFTARIYTLKDSYRANRYINKVPHSLRNDPGLIYARMQFRRKRDSTKGVREMLLAAPSVVPYPEKWWKAREYQIHKAINEKNYTLAKKLLSNHGQTGRAQLASARWLEGWLHNEFLKNPHKAYYLFQDMYNNVSFPVSRARAAYWAGRAAEDANDSSAAARWYQIASYHPTTFYGQLALIKYKKNTGLMIPSPPSVSISDRYKFDNMSIVKAIRLAIALNELTIAGKLINHLVQNVNDTAVIRLATALGHSFQKPHLSVHASKKALQQNIILLKEGYPTPRLPSSVRIDPNLVYAISRQESEFNDQAKSPVGARGIMQLMWRTARSTARKERLIYSKRKLYNFDYNVRLGSAYLEGLIKSYDGSYVKAIAAYNAGPGNVHNWVKQFGNPERTVDGAINWIERIPFSETRNYVQRVLENLQVYRHINTGSKLILDKDLRR